MGLMQISQLFSGLIAAVFYVASYLSFVQLLKYLCNWLPPNLLAWAFTSILMAFLITHLSLSTEGFDGTSLIISVVLASILYFVVANIREISVVSLPPA